MSKKKEFKMPHIVFLIMGLMIFMCILTYIIPAGEFVTSASGINEYVQCDRTPVNPVLIFSLIFEGTVNAASVIALLLLIGASTEIILSTKAIEHVLDYLLYKLQDKGVDILVPCMFSVFCVIGAFATEGVIGLFPVAIFCGLLAHRSFDQIGDSFLKGVRGMSDICIIIGLAGAISLIMKNGKIMDTIAYYCSRPLQGLSLGVTSIGIAGIVGVMNILIPSASAKAASLIPLIKPIAVNLGMAPQLTVQAFQCGDGMMNGVSPFMGQTMGGLEMCKVDYKTWMRWYFPILAVLYVFEFLFLYILATIGWS